VAFYVQKYGGTSVGSTERIKNVARRVAKFHSQGHQIVVVVSAMSGETNRLIALAHEVQENPNPRELDVMISTGEQVSIALLAMALMELNVKAKSYTGPQVRILTDSTHTKARILSIDEAKIRADLDAGYVVVVAGFQGVTDEGQITTLGRGGSDTTAVALAAALGAKECDIYTDVDGVYTADPNVIGEAVPLEEIAYEQCVTLARSGAQVIHPRAVELGEQYDIVVRVRNTFNPSNRGTEIKGVNEVERRKQFCGVAVDSKQGFISIFKSEDSFNLLREITQCLGQCGISVEDIRQSNAIENGAVCATIQICFNYKDEERVADAIAALTAVHKNLRVLSELDLCKVTLVGCDELGNGPASVRVIGCLEANDIKVKSVRTGDISISCLVEKSNAQQAARLIHVEFQLANQFDSATSDDLCLTA